MTKREIIKELYAAAERIETNEYLFCCHAILHSEVRTIFRSLFRKDAHMSPRSDHLIWFQDESEDPDDAEVRSRRVLGLLWCAEMVRSGVAG